MSPNSEIQKLQVFVAALSDVQTEKILLTDVIKQLNDGMGDYLGIYLDIKEWPHIASQKSSGGQDDVYNLLPIEDHDIMIAIIWLKFDDEISPTGKTRQGFASGVEAILKHKEHSGHPNVMFYRCARGQEVTNIDTIALNKINTFFQMLGNPSSNEKLYFTYKTPEEFVRHIRNYLEKLVITYGEKFRGRGVSRQEIQVYATELPTTLPRRNQFFGRKDEILKILRAMNPNDRSWGIIIDGIGGIGKTALAIEVAYLCKEDGAFEGFIFISAKKYHLETAGIREAPPRAQTLDGLFTETALALGHQGVAQATGVEKRRALLEVLQNKHVLLIYDNLETLSKSDQDELIDFLRYLPTGCKAIITSRRRGGDGAILLHLDKLDWEAGLALIKDEMLRDSHLQDILTKAGENKWRELFEEIGGSPLALKYILGLMRVRVPSLTVDKAIDMLKKRGNAALDLLQFIYQETRNELRSNDIKVLSILTFFSSASIDTLAELTELHSNVFEYVLTHLYTLALVNLDTNDRCSLHPLTRNFIQNEFLSSPEQETETGLRFAAYWVSFAKSYGGQNGLESYKNYSKFETEWPNLDAAASWLWKIGANPKEVPNRMAASRLVLLAKSLSQFLSFSGRWDESIDINERAYETARSLDEKDGQTGWRAFDIAWMHYKRSHHKESHDWLEKCMKAWERNGTEGNRATALKLKGLLSQREKQYPDAERYLQEALEIRRKLAENHPEQSMIEIAYALSSLGQLAIETQDYEKAKQHFDEALDINKIIEDKSIQTSLSNNMGKLALFECEWDKAEKWFEEAISVSKEIGRLEVIGRGKYGLAQVWDAKKHPEIALKYALDALQIFDRLQLTELEDVKVLVEKLKYNASTVIKQ